MQALPVRLGEIRVIAVAVSGGADSLALALLANDWAKRRKLRLAALTVDHGLRSQSAVEARRVGAWMQRLGVEHHILRWRGAKPKSNRQAQARAARYRLLAEWCARQGARHLLLAHQLEDQAETFLLRLARGSGVDGLSAMAAVKSLGDLVLLRPLLSVPKARLTATLKARKQEWIEDPSNQDLAYGRVRVRHALVALQGVGLTPERLARTAAHLARARAALQADTEALLRRAARLEDCGYAVLDVTELTHAPEEIGLRALAGLLTAIGGGAFPPRFSRLQRLYRELLAENIGRGRTLGGCTIAPAKDRAGCVLISREAAAVAPSLALAPGQSTLWDNRFLVGLSAAAPKGLAVRALGTCPWPKDAPRPDGIPLAALVSLPALARGRRLLAAPGAGIEGGALTQKAGFTAVFAPRGLAAARSRENGQELGEFPN